MFKINPKKKTILLNVRCLNNNQNMYVNQFYLIMYKHLIYT